MRSLFYLAVLAPLMMLISLPAQAVIWVIDQEDSRVIFKYNYGVDQYEGEFKNVEADKKFSYLIEWLPCTETMPKLYDRIQMHMEISDHVYVDLGEPGFWYKEDSTNFYTPDFINKFNTTDNVTFFGNIIINVPINRPCYYLNDMFYEDIEIYKKIAMIATVRTIIKAELVNDKSRPPVLICI